MEKYNDYQFMKLALEELEDKFSSPDFWYCEFDFIAYAQIVSKKRFNFSIQDELYVNTCERSVFTRVILKSDKLLQKKKS